jgi:hypothetical protein
VLFYTFSVVNFFLITKKCFFLLKFPSFLAPGSGSGYPIRIRIHKVTDSGFNPDPAPQPCKKVYQVSTSAVDSKLFADPTFHRVLDPDPTVLDLTLCKPVKFTETLWQCANALNDYASTVHICCIFK